jgi:hypothetical protein
VSIFPVYARRATRDAPQLEVELNVEFNFNNEVIQL